MQVGIFLASANHPHYVAMLEQFAQGVAKYDSVFLHKDPTYRECDVAVIFGSWKNRPAKHHIAKNTIIEKHKIQQDKPFVVIETPLLGRKIEVEYQWYRVGINHYLNKLGDFNNHCMPGDRWAQLQKEFNISAKPYRKNGTHIVVALQIPGDASLMGTDISEWAVKTVNELRDFTNRPIVIRPHKLVREYRMDLIQECTRRFNDIEFYDPSLSAQRDDLINCWATVTYTSGYAVDSLLAGIPTFPCHIGNMASSLAMPPISQIVDPPTPDRTQFLNDLSYVQWNIQEMHQGLPWIHLRPKLECQ